MFVLIKYEELEKLSVIHFVTRQNNLVGVTPNKTVFKEVGVHWGGSDSTPTEVPYLVLTIVA